MANITSVLKEEITRLARKEIKAETEALKKASSAYRSDIAELKRRAVSLEKQLSKLGKVVSSTATPAKDIEPEKIRFVAKGFRSMREKLGLTAGEIAGLLDVSPAIVYNWEGGLSKPKQPQLLRIAHLRTMGKRDVAAVLSQHSATVQKSKTKAVKTSVAKVKKAVPKAKTDVKAATGIKVATKSVRKPRLPKVKQEPTKEIIVTPAPATNV